MLIHRINLEEQEIEYLIFQILAGAFLHLGVQKKIKEKFEAFAHKEFNNDKFKNVDHIMNCQKTGADLFHRKVQAKKVNKNFFPRDLLELMEQNPTYYFGPNS